MNILFSPVKINSNNIVQKQNPYLRNNLRYDIVAFTSKETKKICDNEYLNYFLKGINSIDKNEVKNAIERFNMILSETNIFFDDDLLETADILIDKALQYSDSDKAELFLSTLRIIALDYNLKEKINFTNLTNNVHLFTSQKSKQYIESFM